MLVPSVTFGNATSANGHFHSGNCAMVDILARPGMETAGSISGALTFANDDSVLFNGSYDNSESSDGLTIGIDPVMTVTFSGTTAALPWAITLSTSCSLPVDFITMSAPSTTE
jgi:hypothetical protein